MTQGYVFWKEDSMYPASNPQHQRSNKCVIIGRQVQEYEGIPYQQVN